MERYKDFTVNTESFPHFSDFVEEMRKSHVHLVPIIDAGVKMEEGYETYEEGCEKDYCVKKKMENDWLPLYGRDEFIFPTFLNPKCRTGSGTNIVFS